MILGLHGKARSGKDTLGNMIVLMGGVRYSFARPLKDACQVMFNWDERHTDGDLKEVVDPYFGFSPRKAMQTLGTEWGRNLDPNLWIKIAQQFVDRNSHKMIVIPDVRFDNEAQFVMDNHGILIHVTRPGQEQIALNSHSSEAGLAPEWMAMAKPIVNDGTINDLHDKLKVILDSHGTCL